MSEIIASAASYGAYKTIAAAEKKWQEAMAKWGAREPVGFPNTAYYLPIIYGMLGMKVEKLGDMEAVLKKCRLILSLPVQETHLLPNVAPALDAGMVTLFAEELIEAIRYVEQPNFYTKAEDPNEDNIWLGAADDIILRRHGIGLIDGTTPGFAFILGAAPTKEIAVKIAKELQEKNLYVFMAAEYNGQRFSQQLVEAGVQTGWTTRLVSFGPDVSATVFALGFATRTALFFGGIKPGDYRNILIYNKERVFAFNMLMGYITDEWYANATAAIDFGFPVIADTPISKVLLTGLYTFEHIVSNIPHENLVAKAIEIRGLKVNIRDISIPVAFEAAFEGEHIKGEDIYLECGDRTRMVEWVTSKRMDEVEDGRIEILGPDIKDISPGTRLPLAIVVEIAGRDMQEDYEPILERQIHHLLNCIQGVMHIGQRDIACLRVSKQAVGKGFLLTHIGIVLHGKLHQDFGRVFDKLQIKFYTEEAAVKKIVEKARTAYHNRDQRIEGMTDEEVETYYSCTICQSIAPNHVCIISPERTGLCGAYNWMDGKIAFEINPTGPNQPVPKGTLIDAKLGQWQGVNEFVFKTSRGKIDHYNLYSIVNDPMTTCGCCECIAAILPLCNGIMTVNREYNGDTPCGMKFTSLAGIIGGGLSTPGFIGHGKYNTTQRKYLLGDGGLLRMTWMPKSLKEEIGDRFKKRAAEMGVPNLLDMVADESIGTSEEAILPFLQKKGHPALALPPLLG
jgi:acetyl-CoA synthase